MPARELKEQLQDLSAGKSVEIAVPVTPCNTLTYVAIKLAPACGAHDSHAVLPCLCLPRHCSMADPDLPCPDAAGVGATSTP